MKPSEGDGGDLSEDKHCWNKDGRTQMFVEIH